MEAIEIKNSDSEDSIIELALPEKPPPPLILIEDEEIVLNVMQKEEEPMLAKEFLQNNQMILATTETENVLGTSSAISPKHWTLDMIKFYNDDWGDEDQFIVEKLQEKMDKSPFLWDVSIENFFNNKYFDNKYRRSNVKCWNCNQRGHHVSMCPDPPNVPKCFMCGIEGHLNYYCPNSKCLNCGNPSGEYVNHCFQCKNVIHEVCSRCHLSGHNYVNCPEHWRRFHLTTNSTSVVVPKKKIYKSEKDMWCCNCGKRGHCQTQCMQLKNFIEFRNTFPYVVSYQRAFAHDHNKDHENIMSEEIHWKTNKGRREYKGGKIFKLHGLNRTTRKGRNYKNKFKKFWKNKRKNKRKQDTRI